MECGLAAITGYHASAPPVHTDDRLRIVFHGEIYNYRALPAVRQESML